MHTIPFLDLKKQYSQIREEAVHAVLKVFEDNAFSGGPYVQKFEEDFARFCGTRYSMGLNNGTSAVHLALAALNITSGDEVIVPANTFIATVWGVSYQNAAPVFVDCDPDTWNIDSRQIQKSITKRTKAIAGVHLYGQPFDVDAVRKIAMDNGLLLVEDCAQAHGAAYKGKRVGGLAEMGCFSFYPGKNLGAFGEAGAVTTNRADYHDRIQSLKNHGSKQKYYHDEVGYNMRMEGVQGAVLSVKLKYLNQWNARRQQIAKIYHKKITNPKIKMQKQPEWAESVYHLFVITTDKRDELAEFLKARQILVGLHYPVPCHLQKAYAHLGYKTGDCPNAEYLARHCLSLPMFPELTDADIDRVVEAVNAF